MPSSNLQGLNIVHQAQESSSADPQDLLLGQAYPDLTAQLDLWTNLSFESDEPLGQRHDERKNALKYMAEEEEEEARSPAVGEKNTQNTHPNVTGSTLVGPQTPAGFNPAAAVAAAAAAAAAAQSFDLNSFLASFGLDAFAAAAAAAHHAPVPQQPQPQPPAVAPSLAQLLALHSAHNAAYTPAGFPHFQLPQAPASAGPSFARNTPSNSTTATTSNPEESHVPAKRARTRKASITTVDSPEDGSPGNTSSAPDSTSSANLTTPLSASEDKRRRNTAASARFRLKKKEREAALEGKAKELETKVLELERECEGLRRENGWLKGLVVGVTGAAAQAPGGPGLAVAPPAPLSTGTKRSRDEVDRA